MKTMKEKLLKKLKTVEAIGYLKPNRIIQVNALDGYLYTSPPKPGPVSLGPLAAIEEEPKKQNNHNMPPTQEPEVVDVSELMTDLLEDQIEFDSQPDDKEFQARDEGKQKCHRFNRS